MNITKSGRVILLGYAFVVFVLCIILVPHAYTRDGMMKYLTFAPLWLPSDIYDKDWQADIDAKMLLIEIFTVTVVTGVLFVLYGISRGKTND